jgi:hypothetical protein
MHAWSLVRCVFESGITSCTCRQTKRIAQRTASYTGANDHAICPLGPAGCGFEGHTRPRVDASAGARSSCPHVGPVKPGAQTHTPLARHSPKSSQSSSSTQPRDTTFTSSGGAASEGAAAFAWQGALEVSAVSTTATVTRTSGHRILMVVGIVCKS